MDFLPQNNQSKVACILVLDGSSSMNIQQNMKTGFSRIDALNNGVQVFRNELLNDVTAKSSVDIAILKITDPQPEIVQNWIEAEKFQPSKLTAAGTTPIAAALTKALEMSEERKRFYSSNGMEYFRPWIIVISDGAPTDSEQEWNNAVNLLKNAIERKKVFPMAVAIDKCPTDKLQQISEISVVELSSHRFSEFFQWLSNSIGSTLRSNDGTEQFAAQDLIS